MYVYAYIIYEILDLELRFFDCPNRNILPNSSRHRIELGEWKVEMVFVEDGVRVGGSETMAMRSGAGGPPIPSYN